MSDEDEDNNGNDDGEQLHMQDVCDIVEPATNSNHDKVSTMVELET